MNSFFLLCVTGTALMLSFNLKLVRTAPLITKVMLSSMQRYWSTVRSWLTYQKRLTAIRRLPCANAMHWEKRRGSREDARKYSMKEDTREDGPFEFGEWDDSAQGKRSDLALLADAIKGGASLATVAEDHTPTYIRYHRGIAAYMHLRQPPARETPPTIHLLMGPPGCGKTRTFYDSEAPEDRWVSPAGSALQWFDGYHGQPAALLDDFDGRASKVPLQTLLTILDRSSIGYVYDLLSRYVQQVAVKGGHAWWSPERVYVTTNIHPRNWYDWSSRESQYDALKRRFTRITYWPESPAPDADERYDLVPDRPFLWDLFWRNAF